MPYHEWKSFSRNEVVEDEGNGVGVKYWVSFETCASFCEETSGCNSFAHCEMSEEKTGDCWLKDKFLDGNEPSKISTNGCTTYYKSSSGK